jgi:hypothetical protein
MQVGQPGQALANGVLRVEQIGDQELTVTWPVQARPSPGLRASRRVPGRRSQPGTHSWEVLCDRW